MCEDINCKPETKVKKQVQFYEAVLKDKPAKWNSFCYVVESVIEGTPTTIYLSESSLGKPIHKEINDKGYIYIQYLNVDSSKSYVYVWVNEK